MQLNKLLKNYNIDINESVEVNDLCSDSRMVKPGDLFFALSGEQFDASEFISAAIEKGAVAVVKHGKAIKIEKSSGVMIITLPNLANELGLIASEFFNAPSKEMMVIGITGTNGKTSICYLLALALKSLGHSCGIIGTLGSGLADDLVKTIYTTPDAINLQRQLADFRDKGITTVAMEVSSHALDQGRVNGVHFNTAIFTNLTRDHLDYHPSLDDYAKTKRKLFDFEGLESAIINADDPYGRQWMAEIHDKVDTFSYTIAGAPHDSVKNIIAKEASFDVQGVSATVSTPWGEIWLSSRLLGRFNLSNLLAVLTCLCSMGYELKSITDIVESLPGVPGRMQTFRKPGYPLVVVDYAHTPDALEKVLQGIREHKSGKLVCVFGCGGDRDRGKRSLMAEAVESYADSAIITNDNPRNEAPDQIVDDIRAGFKGRLPIKVMLNRAKAINKAITTTPDDGIVLIAGKGHEKTQTISGKVLPFSDVDEVNNIMSAI